MITAWKRFINKNDVTNGNQNVNNVPPGVQKLDKELQRKFARGVNYNMRVVIKGDARVGKTSLFSRLRGAGFEEDCPATETLNVTSIDWNYKATDDVVKIDIWEVIDGPMKRVNNVASDLKVAEDHQPTTSNNNNNDNNCPHKTQDNNNQCSDRTINASQKSANTIMDGGNRPIGSRNSRIGLDSIPESAKQSLIELSAIIDVYKGTNAVLLVMDMTKLWTFKYVTNELPKIPKHIPVLVIANFRDQGHHRTVSNEQIKTFIEGVDRTPCDGVVMYTEASMRNGFGIKMIEKFFNIPFLRLQETSLLKQLELNRCEFMTTKEELQIMQESMIPEYEQYLELQTILRRQQADATSPVNSGFKQLDESTREQIRNATASSDGMDKNLQNAKSIESNNNIDKQSSNAALVAASKNFVNDRMASIVIGAKCPLPEPSMKIQLNSTAGCNSLAGSSAMATKPSAEEQEKQHTEAGGEDDSDDDEVPCANPLVASYQSDLDSDDQGA